MSANSSSLEYPADKVPSIRQVMMPRDTNALGTIFGGVILAQVDLAAAIEAHKAHPGRIVTVSMDKVVFRQPVFVGDLVSFFTDTQLRKERSQQPAAGLRSQPTFPCGRSGASAAANSST